MAMKMAAMKKAAKAGPKPGAKGGPEPTQAAADSSGGGVISGGDLAPASDGGNMEKGTNAGQGIGAPEVAPSGLFEFGPFGEVVKVATMEAPAGSPGYRTGYRATGVTNHKKKEKKIFAQGEKGRPCPRARDGPPLLFFTQGPHFTLRALRTIAQHPP